MVDEVLVMIMRGPKTYTGEDTVEIDCHGGVLAMKRVLETVIQKRVQDRGTGRIYQKSAFSKRKAGSVSGRGSYGCDPGEE